VTAQEAKVQALKQAEEIRKEKERLRTRVNAHKQTNGELSRVNDRLQAKILLLQEENELLRQGCEQPAEKHKAVMRKV